jgi:hypothetical protein
MEEKTPSANKESHKDSPLSHQEVRLEARRRLIKTGLMSVPFMMTVYSRPLFAQGLGSIGATVYGEYGAGATATEIVPQNETATENPFAQSYDYTGGQEEFNFTRTRNPRAQPKQ